MLKVVEGALACGGPSLVRQGPKPSYLFGGGQRGGGMVWVLGCLGLCGIADSVVVLVYFLATILVYLPLRHRVKLPIMSLYQKIFY